MVRFRKEGSLVTSRKLSILLLAFCLSFAGVALAVEEDHTWSLSGELAGQNSAIKVGVQNTVALSAFNVFIRTDTTKVKFAGTSQKLGRAVDVNYSLNASINPSQPRAVQLLGYANLSNPVDLPTGSGDIISVRFNVKSGVPAGTVIRMKLTKLDSTVVLATQDFVVQDAGAGLQLQPLQSSAVNLGRGFDFTLRTADATLTGLTFAMPQSPGAGAALDPATGRFTWTPAAGGRFPALFTVTNGSLMDSLAVTLKVNRAPVLPEIASREVTLGQTLTLNLQATDADQDTLVYRRISPITLAGATLDSLTGVFRWTPAAAATITIIFEASDRSVSDSVTVQLTAAAANLPPVWNVTADTLRLIEGQAFSQAFTAPSDESPSTLTISALNLPTGAQFTASTRTFAWTPGMTAAGTYQFTLLAVDNNSQRATKLVTVVVADVNRAPVLTVAASTVWARRGATVSFPVSATDPDGQAVVLSALNLPTGASLRGSEFFWSAAVAGTFDLSIIGSDPAGLADTVQVQLVIEDVNSAPSFQPVTVAPVEAGAAVSFQVQATDPDGDQLSYYIIPTRSAAGDSISILSRGATFSGQSFSWTPATGDIGSNVVTFGARDPGGLIAQLQVTIVVNGLGLSAPPQFFAFGDTTISEGQQFSFPLPLLNQSRTGFKFWAIGLPTGAVFDTISGTLSWTPTLTQSGSYAITCGVTDRNFQDIKELRIAVDEVDVDPVLSTVGALTIREDSLLKLTLVGRDVSGDPVSFEAGGLPAGAELFANGLLQFRPTYDQSGQSQVTFTVTDVHGKSDSEVVTLAVTDVNRPPVLVVENQTGTEGEPLSFTVSASDPDGAAVTLAQSGLPSGATFVAATGAVSWTPGSTQGGLYHVVFTASDGQVDGIDRDTVVIAIGGVNRPPVLDQIGDLVVNEGGSLSFQFVAADPDADNRVTLTAVDLPQGAQLAQSGANPVTGTVTFAAGYRQQGVYRVKVTATDNDPVEPLSAKRNFKLEVMDLNIAPVFTGALSGAGELRRTITEGETLELAVTAEDQGGDALTFAAMGLPRRAVAYLESSPRKLVFTADYDQAGEYSFQVSVSDGQNVVNKLVRVTVTELNRTPRVVQIQDQYVRDGQAISFQVAATDLDGDALTIGTAGQVPFLTQGTNPPARLRDGNVFFFDTGLLPVGQPIPSAFFKFWAVDARGAVSDTVAVEIVIERTDSTSLTSSSTYNNSSLGIRGLGYRNSSSSSINSVFSAASGFFQNLPRPTLLAAAGEEESPKQRQGVYTFLAGDLTSQFYGIRRGWGLDLTALTASTGASTVVTLSYFQDDLPTEVPNFTEDKIRVFGYKEATGSWVLMDSVTVKADSNLATFRITDFTITRYTLGAVLDVIAPIISDFKVLGGAYTVNAVTLDTLYNLGGSYTFRLNVTDDELLDDSHAAVMLYYRLEGQSAFTELALARSGVNLFSVLVQQAVQSGSVIEYYVAAADKMNTVTSPVGAPGQFYRLVLSEPTFQPGDVDQSGVINIFDLLDLLRVLGGSKPDGPSSDVNVNGKTDIFDLLELLRKLAG